MLRRILAMCAAWTARFLIFLRYRITVEGLEEIAAGGRQRILFLPNHPAFIDPIMLASRLLGPFRVRPLADADQINRPVIRQLCTLINTLEVPDLGKRGTGQVETIRKVMNDCVEALQRDENLLLYPAGHTKRQRHENIGGSSAVDMIVRRVPDVRIVLMRTTGLWGSRFSRASGESPSVGSIVKSAAWLLPLNGFFFMPRRRVHVTLVEPKDFPREGGRKVINRYLENFYNAEAPPANYVPYGWWERGGEHTLPEPRSKVIQGDPSRAPTAVRERVWGYLVEQIGAQRCPDSADLSRDLGMDSLAKAGLLVWLTQEFGFSAPDIDALQTVGDVMLAACGEVADASTRELKEASEAWTRERPELASLDGLEKMNIARAFVRQARRNPGRRIVADQSAGEKTYRELILGIYALRPKFAALDGRHVGILLPASVGATVCYYSVLLAGKTPVMVNWTTGSRNLRLTLDPLGVKAILTSRQVIEPLKGRGIDLSAIEDRFVYLEDVRASLSLGDKLAAALRTRLTRWGDLERAEVSEHAVVLFTSGSESAPKAVPLTHRNILSDLRAAWELYDHAGDHCILGMLPPFHSFGLTVCMVLTTVSGTRVAFYPDPTDSAMLGRIIENYGCTMLIGTPSFLFGIARTASAERLQSLRLVVTGAEACGQEVYDLVAAKCPQTVILEGYGITECGPIVSCNRQWDTRPRTIGKLLDGMESLIVNPDTLEEVEPGARGLLLVRGPNVFGGYLGENAPDPFVEAQGRRWYRTGDLVTAEPDGWMTFRGRLKRFVKLGGEMISLPAIEEVLRRRFADPQAKGPTLAVTPSGREGEIQLVLCSVGELSREDANAAIREAGLSGLHNVRRVLTIDEIPVLGTGKTDYKALDRLVAEDAAAG